MKIIVMGAGVIGTASAWYLQQQGHEVIVLERNAGAARETSYANGCQISVSHAEPWANPAAPFKVFKWLFRDDAPLLFRPRLDALQLKWSLQFLLECPAARSLDNMKQLVNLGTYSRDSLQELRRTTGIQYDHLEKGIIHFYTNQQEFDACLEPARVMREMGCERDVIDRDAVIKLEPALRQIKDSIVGATYTSADESGDIHKFTVNLAKLSEDKGVKFRYGVRVQAIRMAGEKVAGIEIANEEGGYEIIKGDAYVMAMGSFSPLLLQEIGINALIYPAKGYSATLPILKPEFAPQVSLTDDEYKLVFSRLGDRLRIAGTAELNGYNMALNPVRCDALVRRTMQLFPGMSEPHLAQFWTGLRPATPSNVPYIGTTRYSNLYINTGHGTLGWTHGCGSGRAIADIISGRIPEVNFKFTVGL
jgi:D-amino-acid dehydrogenase